MDSNTHSAEPRARSSAEYSAGPPDSLAAFTAAAEELAAQDLSGLPDAVRAERVLGLRRLLDRLEGHWLQESSWARTPTLADENGAVAR
jgi:hypothetical protein